jgi:ribosomal protein S2
MSETPETPAPTSAPETPAAPAAAATDAAAAPEGASQIEALLKKQELTMPALIEAGVHYGHQPGRWNPLMRNYIFGERNGTHIIDLDQTLPLLKEALEFIRETTAAGGSVLFVGTKRQAQGSIMLEAQRAKQHYVNNRWLGGMLTNWKTVKKSIDRYNQYLDILGNEEKREELSKKEQSSMQRQVEKYAKSLEGIRSMDRPPDAIFIIDVGTESIAVQEAKRTRQSSLLSEKTSRLRPQKRGRRPVVAWWRSSNSLAAVVVRVIALLGAASPTPPEVTRLKVGGHRRRLPRPPLHRPRPPPHLLHPPHPPLHRPHPPPHRPLRLLRPRHLLGATKNKKRAFRGWPARSARKSSAAVNLV